MLEEVMNIAVDIASKSPVGIQMTKRSIIYSRDHTVQEGLDHIVSLKISSLLLIKNVGLSNFYTYILIFF